MQYDSDVLPRVAYKINAILRVNNYEQFRNIFTYITYPKYFTLKVIQGSAELLIKFLQIVNRAIQLCSRCCKILLKISNLVESRSPLKEKRVYYK